MYERVHTRYQLWPRARDQHRRARQRQHQSLRIEHHSQRRYHAQHHEWSPYQDMAGKPHITN